MEYLKTYEAFINEAKPYHKSKIVVFDLDDTLVISAAKIKVCNKKTGECYSLTPEEFNLFANQAQLEVFEGYFFSLANWTKKQNQRNALN